MGNLYDGLSISVSYGCTLINTNQPLDIRTVVNSYSDIASIPNPYIGMTITVKVDETNNGKMTDYKVKSLKTNSDGVANSIVNEVVRLDEYIGVNGKANNSDLLIERNRVDNLENVTEEISSQLDSKANESEVIKKGKVDLDEMTERTLQAIQGGQGATFNLLSIPRDGSVTPCKTDFLTTNENILNLDDVDDDKYFIDYKPWIKDGVGYSCIKIPVLAND